ncbi:MAG: hypothetical protein II804_08670 [Clostridia bacterium]|nr:hypothetical protein [Clostridia bacterium]
MTTEQEAVKLDVKNGKIVCPRCRRTTQQVVRPDTSARHLQVWCRGCKAEFLVDIDSGQCFESPC